MTRTTLARFAAPLLIVMFTAACAAYEAEPDFQRSLAPDAAALDKGDSWPPYRSVYTQRFVWKMRYLADRVATGLPGREPGSVSILTTTLVPVDDLSRSTSFGRLCTEQLMSELGRRGYRVVEARKADAFMIRDKEGEFALTRDVARLPGEHPADAVLVGTYAAAGESVLVNVRLVEVESAETLAVGTAQMDLRGDRFLTAIFKKDEPKNGAPLMSDGPAPVAIRKRVVPGEDPYSDLLDSMVHDMAWRVGERVPARDGGPGTVAVASFVNVDNFYSTATFGRFLGERMIGELTDLGYGVREIRLAPEIYTGIRAGEMALTRELSRIMDNLHADAILVGTYATADDQVLVNGRLVMAGSGRVVGVGQMVVQAGEKNKFVAAMLDNETMNIPPSETVEGY